jgi:hypothetical protein
LFLIFCVGAIFSATGGGKDQSNNISQLTAGVNKVMQETSRAGAILSAGIESAALANTLASAKSRADLERCLSSLKTGEANAASAMPRYEALLTQERNDRGLAPGICTDRDHEFRCGGIGSVRAQAVAATADVDRLRLV